MSQGKNLKAVLTSIYDTKVKIKMLNNRIELYEDYEKKLQFLISKEASNTILTVELKNVNNKRIIDQTLGILKEQ